VLSYLNQLTIGDKMDFEDFWKRYPRKVAKKTAMQSFAKLPMDEQELALDVVDNHIEYWKLKETAMEFIPHPATWLNQGRYYDELDMKPKAPVKPALPWYSTEQLTMDKARELGMQPRPGEDMAQFRTRIAERVAQTQ
jgi:hypothetical protein